MPHRTHPLVGRGRELATLARALDEAAAGRGNLWLICGEPGIGKSRLLEEMATLAADRDMNVLWARCWGGSGAPSYWPWIQVLRAVMRGEDSATVSTWLKDRRPALGKLLPELDNCVVPSSELRTPSLDVDASFQLYDAIAGVLTDVGECRPTLVLIEDLHAADLSSIRLLEFLAGPIRSARVAVAGMYRDTAARDAEAGPALLRLAREVRPIHLAPLSRDAVVAFLAQAIGETPGADMVDTVLQATGGNPLFLSEAARVIAQSDACSASSSVSSAGDGAVLSDGVAKSISEGIAALSPGMCQVAVSGTRSNAGIRLEREGEYWLLIHSRGRLRLKDTKGVRLLARLVDEPGREFHAMDLASEGRVPGGSEPGPGGEILDADARRQYRCRVTELTAQLQEATSWNDMARAERTRSELAFLTAELSRAVGLGGRSRGVGSPAERARISVQRRLRDAIRRIEQCDAELGRQLTRCVQTGTYCSYTAD
ncbi:MAG: AAA family ATPase [Nannocystaceae bacterium]